MRRSTFLILTLFSLSILASCESEECKECEQVTYDSNDNEIDREDEGEFCGEALEDKENEEGEVGNQRYEYECTS